MGNQAEHQHSLSLPADWIQYNQLPSFSPVFSSMIECALKL